MKELFVTYEAAKKLADFGFKEECICVHFNSVDGISQFRNSNNGDGYVKLYNSSNEKGISAPLKMQAIFWLMERIGEKDLDYFTLRINICSDQSGTFDNIKANSKGPDTTVELYEFVDLNDAIDYLISLYKNL